MRRLTKAIKRYYKYAIATIAAASPFLFTTQYAQWHSNYIVSKAGSQVVKLTPTDNRESGGTGFAVRTDSGKVYTLSNGHVCGISKTGNMLAHVPGTGRAYLLRILEIASDTDLCLLEGVPNAEGISLASGAEIGDDVSIVGHPLLQPLTYVTGKLTAEQEIQIMVDHNNKEEACQGEGYIFKDLSGTINELFGIHSVCLRSLRSILTTAGIYPGNSGSPTVNQFGNLVGVVFAANQETHYGFVIPLDKVRQFLSIY